MRKLTLTALLNSLALYIASLLFKEIIFSSLSTLLIAGIILALVNLLIRPLFLLLTLPFSLLTLGFFILVVDTWMIFLTAALLPSFQVDGFVTVFLTSIIVSLINWSLKNFVNK